MKHIYKIFVISLVLFFAITIKAQTVVINEFMSSNSVIISDEDGDFSDWIEIYNNSGSPINIENYSLSDNIDEPNKWVFPSLELDPYGYLLIFASAKDRYSINELHTNFKIKQSGEELLLSNSLGIIVSSIEPIYVPGDQSYGSFPDGVENRIVFTQPTPNNSNVESNEINCSHPSGFYNEGFLLSLVPTNENQSIFYTINGEVPSVNSLQYTSPILISNISSSPNSISTIPTTPLEGPWQLQYYMWMEPENAYKTNVLRFASFEDGEMMSQVFSKTYFVDPHISSHYSFPIISLITDSLNLFQYDTGIYIPGLKYEQDGWGWVPAGNYQNRGIEWERNIHLSYFEYNGSLAFETDAGMRMRGNGSVPFPQKSFGVYFRKEYGIKKIDYPIFDNSNTSEYKRLVFRSSGNDFLETHFRDALLQNLLKSLDLELQNFQASIIFINGEYWGIHGIREKYDKYYFKYHFGIEEDNINILGVCGSPEEGSYTDYYQLVEFMETNDMSLTENYLYVNDHLDIDNFIDFQIAEIYYANYDWPCNNYKMWKTNDAGSKWRFLIYDLDLSFAFDNNSLYNTHSMEHATHVEAGWPFCGCSSILFRKLLENDEFEQQFINRFAYHLNTTFHTQTILDSIDKYKELFIPEIEEHIDRWSYPANYTLWEEQINNMKDFARKRPCFMRENIMSFFDISEFDFECEDTSVYDLESNVLKVFPNPSNGDHITIELPNHGLLAGSYRIVSLDGRELRRGELETYSFDVNVSDFAEGFYLIHINNDTQKIVGKIVISD